ncbi:T9SS type A sorting domain-containing protein [Aureispira]|nr:T9SS type A sorting domain-containing protein [Aureispira sp.]
MLSCSYFSISQVTYSFNYGGLTRSYKLYKPLNLIANAPLVFVLHGYSGSPNSIMNYSEMNSLADTAGFAVCYPKGEKDQSNNRFWNVGYAFHPNQNHDDVGFLDSLAKYLQAQHSLSSLKTFSCGMSNGGEMSYMLACQKPQTFKAVASVAGTMFASYYNTCLGSATPVLEIHGTNDNVNAWNGDYTNAGGWGVYYHMDTIINLWIQNNGCSQSIADTLPNIDPNDGSIVYRTQHLNLLNNKQVWLYTVDGGGHDWPGDWGNMDIHSGSEIWHFFSQFLSFPLAKPSVHNTGSMINLYPNPVLTTLHIQRNVKKMAEYKIITNLGQVYKEGLLNTYNSEIDLAPLETGVYFLKVNNQTFRIIKLKS